MYREICSYANSIWDDNNIISTIQLTFAINLKSLVSTYMTEGYTIMGTARFDNSEQ